MTRLEEMAKLAAADLKAAQDMAKLNPALSYLLALRQDIYTQLSALAQNKKEMKVGD